MNSPRPAGSPSLAELLARYLEQRAADQAAGLASSEPAGEVFPFEAAPVQPIEPRAAWEEAVAAARLLAPSVDVRSWHAPPEWATVVGTHEPVTSLAFCVGNFPQLVRELQPLIHTEDVGALRPSAAAPLNAPALVEWAKETFARKDFSQRLLALGCLRLARHFDLFDKLAASDEAVSASGRAAWENEKAAAEWHRGRAIEARAMWLKQADSVPVLFNRGMAALFLGETAAARSALEQAVSQIPETSAWHHLGRLYQTLAEVRR